MSGRRKKALRKQALKVSAYLSEREQKAWLKTLKSAHKRGQRVVME